jgi:ADP-ribosyl-[dinitrogen reductase] hydrolase
MVKADPDRARGCLLGLAVGDAVGTTLEFKPRGSFQPITDILGGGPFHLRAGQWTDDTSMALCLAASLVERKGFDAADQMERYSKWLHDGYMSSAGRCFDIGNTTMQAIQTYRQTGNPSSGLDWMNMAGNGSLMRLAPIPLFYFPDLDQTVNFALESSRTTHAALECLDACRLFAGMLLHALSGRGKDEILSKTNVALSAPKILAIAEGAYRLKSIDQIQGTGYVVDCLEAALWCFDKTETFEAAILQAANLGDDADTTAAVCGQIAGAHYGESGIPAHWLQRLHMRLEIKQLAEQLAGIV